MDSLKGGIRDSVRSSAVRQELLCSIAKAAEELERKEFGLNLRFWLQGDSPEVKRLREIKNMQSEQLLREPIKLIPKSIRKSMEDDVSQLTEKTKGYDDDKAKLWKKLEKREKERTEE